MAAPRVITALARRTVTQSAAAAAAAVAEDGGPDAKGDSNLPPRNHAPHPI
jgi:hypothetical protein